MDPYQYINSFAMFGNKGGYKPGLKRMKALLEPFGNPQNKINTIHVAGSNGKGSTIAFLSSIYQEAGFKVGVYTSPHLLCFNERMQINGQYIKNEELAELIEMVKPVIEDITDSQLGRPTFFEVVTALAFLHFYRQKVDVLLLEVGLGGRLDATNIIKSSLISVITGISLEHTSILGNSLEKIAREKAGIVKDGCPVVVAVKNKKVFKTIKDIAAMKGAPLQNIFDLYHYNLKESTLEGMLFKLGYQEEIAVTSILKGDYFIGLIGEHQIRNALLAMTVVDKLLSKLPVSQAALKTGLKKASIPGRMEVIQKNPLILLEGAHNVEGIESLVLFLKNIRKRKEGRLYKKIYVIFAVLKDKDVIGMIKKLAELNNIELIISKNKNKRALDPKDMKKVIDKTDIPYQINVNLKQAFRQVCQLAKEDDIIVVTGSLYTVAEIM